MTNYAYGAPVPVPDPKRNPINVVLVVIFALLAMCCAGLVITLTNVGDDKPHASVQPTPISHPSKASSAVAPAVAKGLAASDLSLKVKTTSKQCFGSAGCNVGYTIQVTFLRDPSFDPPCEVTYEVRGLEDTQTATLRLLGDGSYEQDGYQSGQTSSSSKKLTAKVTDVVCS